MAVANNQGQLRHNNTKSLCPTHQAEKSRLSLFHLSLSAFELVGSGGCWLVGVGVGVGVDDVFLCFNFCLRER